MKSQYKVIAPEVLEQAQRNAWSIENMAAHGAADRTIEYVGSSRKGKVIYDYYRDSTGAWWYGNRGIVDGHIVSMEVYIFGKEIQKERIRKWNRNS